MLWQNICPWCVCVLHCLESAPKDVGAIFNSFEYFVIILIVSTNYILVHLLDNKVF